jgi:hypothetical protein
MMSRLGNVGGRLYRGEVSVNFVGRKRTWYAISGAILLISIVALVVCGLAWGTAGLRRLRYGAWRAGSGRRRKDAVMSR